MPKTLHDGMKCGAQPSAGLIFDDSQTEQRIRPPNVFSRVCRSPQLMLSFSPQTEPEAAPPTASHAETGENPYDLNTEIPAASEPSAPKAESEFVMGPRQMASLAFVAIIVLGIMSAVAYFAGRKNTEASAPKVTERIIERIITAPPPPVAAKPVVQQAPTTQIVTIPPPLESKATRAEVTAPILNRLYLQAGSVEVGVAEVMVEGLRHRGIPAIVGIGVNSKVARILVGPFDSSEAQRIAQKKIEDMGFHPYPRTFNAKDLEQSPAEQAPVPVPAKPPAN